MENKKLLTERELRQIHRNNILLASLQAEYENVCGSTGISPIQSDGMPHSSYKMSGMVDVEKKVDIEMTYRKLYTENQRLIVKARLYIEQFPNAVLRMVLTERYINGLDYARVAADVGITMRQCAEICRVHFNNVF